MWCVYIYIHLRERVSVSDARVSFASELASPLFLLFPSFGTARIFSVPSERCIPPRRATRAPRRFSMKFVARDSNYYRFFVVPDRS